MCVCVRACVCVCVCECVRVVFQGALVVLRSIASFCYGGQVLYSTTSGSMSSSSAYCARDAGSCSGLHALGFL